MQVEHIDLHLIAKKGHVDTLSFWFDRGADVNQLDAEGKNATTSCFPAWP